MWPSQTRPILGIPITPLTSCCCFYSSCLRFPLLGSSLSLSSHTNGGAVVVSPPACTLPTTIWQLLTAVLDQVRQILRVPSWTS